MVQILHTITLRGGAQVELLATPALFDIARKKGMTIEADADNMAEVFSAYTKLVYIAAINAWEVRRYDDAAMGDFPYRLMDFVEWSSGNAEEFVNVINFTLSALTGKDLKDYATEQAKGSEIEKETANTGGEEVKKKSASTWITRLLRRSL
jgi:hypothetical protein